MKRVGSFVTMVTTHMLIAWLIVLAAALGLGVLAGNITQQWLEHARLSHLGLMAQQRAGEIESQTLNGKKMGAIALIGLIDGNTKREARGQLAANSTDALTLIESISRAHQADGAFIVGSDGMMKSSWRKGQVTTGMDMRFRPYYQTAMKGTENIYAAVGTNSGERTLYLAAPIHEANDTESPVIGAVVMRSGVDFLSPLLASAQGDNAVLLSPQGVVFASNQEDWLGRLAGPASADRIKAIRDLKQFGKKFDDRDPEPLPFAAQAGIIVLDGVSQAVATVPVKWNDPGGDWSLMLTEDLSRTVPAASRMRVGLITTVLTLFFGWLLIYLFRSRYARLKAGEQLAAFAHEQHASSERKAELAAVGVRMQQVNGVEDLLHCYLDETHHSLGALQGVVYLVSHSEPNTLELGGSFACAVSPPASLRFGEGLLGQCACERRTQIIESLPDGFGVIRSGLGETRPTALLLGPIQHSGELLGVVELAFLKTPGDNERKRFEEITALLAMNLGILDRRIDTEQMLALTRAAEESKAEQLAFQQMMVDTIPYPVFFKDSDSRYLGINTAYEETFKVKREDVIGKRVIHLDYLPEADRVVYQAENEEVIATIGKIKRPMKIPFADGQLHDTLYYLSGFRRRDGSPGGLVGSFIDLGVSRGDQDAEVHS